MSNLTRRLKIREEFCEPFPEEDIDRLIKWFADEGILATAQEVLIIWGWVSREVYQTEWVEPNFSHEELGKILFRYYDCWTTEENYD